MQVLKFTWCTGAAAGAPKFQSRQEFDRICDAPHTLFGEYPPKNTESEIKTVTETGEYCFK